MLIYSGNQSKSTHLTEDVKSSPRADRCARSLTAVGTRHPHTAPFLTPTPAHRHISDSSQVIRFLFWQVWDEKHECRILESHFKRYMGTQRGVKSTLLINELESGRNSLDKRGVVSSIWE